MRERRHLLAVQVGHLGVQQRWRLVGVLELSLQFLTASVERLDLGLALVYRDLVIQHQVQELLDPRADALDLAFRGGQAGAALHAQPVHLAGELVAELLEQFLVQQLLLQGLQHARLDFVAPDGQVVVATPLVARAEASEPVLARHDESSAADAALRQSGKQVMRPLRCAEGASGLHRVARLFLPRLRCGPEVVWHDAQLWDFLPHPLGFRIEARDSLSRVRVLHVAEAVPNQPTDVQLVVQNPGAALAVAVDRARAPRASERSGDAFTIQVLRDLLRRDASDELAKDPLDDARFVGHDLALSRRHCRTVQCLHDSIAVAEPAGRLTILDATTESTVCLLDEILQEQGVHRALESDVQVRDVALGNRDDVHAGESEPLEESGRVFLVAAEAVQRLGEHDIESAVQRIAHQRLEARAQKGGA